MKWPMLIPNSELKCSVHCKSYFPQKSQNKHFICVVSVQRSSQICLDIWWKFGTLCHVFVRFAIGNVHLELRPWHQQHSTSIWYEQMKTLEESIRTDIIANVKALLRVTRNVIYLHTIRWSSASTQCVCY